jgi:hypothetical protein
MRNITIYPLLTAFAVCMMLFASCKKNWFSEPTEPTPTYGLPAYTETGRGTFGFLLSDTTWLPGCSSWIDPSGAALYVDRAQITASNRCGARSQHLQMSMPPFSEGTFRLDDLGFDAYYIDYNPPGGGSAKSYICSQRDSAFTKFEILHYDSVKHIMSGRFQMKMYRPTVNQILYTTKLAERDSLLNFSDSIVIRDGRFDVVHR